MSVFFRKIKICKEKAELYVNSGDLPPGSGIWLGNNMYYDHNVCSETVKHSHGILPTGERVWEKKPIIYLGHDESIFKQYQYSPKAWVDDRKVAPLIPKDEGAGVMISAFQFRDLGFGHRPLTDAELLEVNKRRAGTDYLDKEAALKIRGTTKKGSITDPFVVFFEYGKKGWLLDVQAFCFAM